MSKLITVLVDLPPGRDAYDYTVTALDHTIDHSGLDVRYDVVTTDAITDLGDGVVVGPGSPYNDPAAAEAAIERARLEGIPLVGT